METKVTLKVVRTGVKRVLRQLTLLRGRDGSGNKGNFEGGQNQNKTCSHILEDRECNPLFVTMDTSCKLYFKRDNILQLHNNNSFVDCKLPSPPLNVFEVAKRTRQVGGRAVESGTGGSS